MIHVSIHIQAEAAQLNKEIAETAAEKKREQEVRSWCIGLKKSYVST